MICAVTGLSSTFAGEGLGCEKDSMPPLLEPVLSYRIIPPDGTDMHLFFGQIKKLEEEEPQLHICFNEQLHEIYVRIMGEVQLEILETLIKQRFGIDVAFGEGSIAYKETIAAPVVGIGHYEPLRHYAEVHLLIEPLEEGSGLVFDTSCSEDVLAGNWQRLILTHLAEKTHIGVLTGSPITDMRITVVSGKSHIKHTEGGDFRQATYRAVRMGLKSAESILLEPYYSFRIEVPAECLGRTLSDLQQMDAEFSSPMSDGNTAELTGNVPVSEIRGYHTILSGYTHGKGRLSCMFKGYYPCRNADEVIEKIGYDSDADVDNPSDSIFCSSGATIVVKWDEVRKRSHMDSGIYFGGDEEENTPTDVPERSVHTTNASDDELMEIFERTYGKIKRDPIKAMRRDREENDYSKSKPVNIPSGPVYLLVDGYNIIFAWDELRKLAAESLDLARSRLINILCSYQGYKQCRLILVFDAYKVAGNNRETEKIGGITVIYTKESETADMYIEKAAYKLAKENRVRVATSDGMEQMIIMGRNAYRVSANEFYEEVRAVERELEEIRYTNSIKGKNTISGL
jgi:predicted RNA-binding protein with PIN domain